MIDITLQEGDGFGDDVGSGMLDSRPSSRRGSISAPSGRRRKTSQAWRPKVRAYFLTHSLSLSLSLYKLFIVVAMIKSIYTLAMMYNMLPFHRQVVQYW